MDQYKRTPEEDDGRVIADMSGVKRHPLIVPDVSNIRKAKEDRAAQAEQQSFNTVGSPEILDKEGRRAMMGGALSAMLLVGGVIFAAFALLILLIGHLA